MGAPAVHLDQEQIARAAELGIGVGSPDAADTAIEAKRLRELRFA